MDTRLPWADSMYYRPGQVAKMLDVTDSYIKKLSDKSGIKPRQIGDNIARVYSVDDVFAIARWRRNNAGQPALARQTVLSVYLPKGGVGKTTSAIEITTHLALFGFSTLVIDLDPQGDLSQGMGYDPEMTEAHAVSANMPADAVVKNSFANLFDIARFYDPVDLEEVVKKPYGDLGPHIIPADVFLQEFEDVINIQPNKEKLISTLLQRARIGALKNFDTSKYDFIIFDCAPGNSVLMKNALLASDYVIAPVALSIFSTKGLSRFSRALISMEDTFGIAPQPFVVPTMFEPILSRISDNIQILSTNFGDALSKAVIRKTEDFSAALKEQKPLALHKPRSVGASDYRDMTKEFVAMITTQNQQQGALEL
jgi:chromosome partitioning protein